MIAAPPTTAAPATGRPVVLLVDDDENLLRATRRALRQQPYDVCTAADGHEAIRFVKSHSVDLIVSDECMPGINGTEMLGWIARELPDTVRVLLTGQGSLAAATRAVNECGVFRFLTKPCKDFELAMAIRDGLEFRRLRSENRDLLELTRTQLAQLEASHRELNLFSRALVHDLAQPLNAVLGYCDLARNDSQVRLNAETRAHLDAALAAAQRMRQLMGDLRDYLTAGSSSEPPKSVHLGVVVSAIVEDLALPLAEAGGSVEVEPLPTVLGHETRLMQVFSNLLGNAVKYRSEAPPRIRVSACEADGAWIVTVADNGIGIPADQADQVFEPFHRAHRDLGRPGTGLGLATCRRIVEQHRGTISVHPAPGGGSIFRITLPGD